MPSVGSFQSVGRQHKSWTTGEISPSCRVQHEFHDVRATRTTHVVLVNSSRNGETQLRRLNSVFSGTRGIGGTQGEFALRVFGISSISPKIESQEIGEDIPRLTDHGTRNLVVI